MFFLHQFSLLLRDLSALEDGLNLFWSTGHTCYTNCACEQWLWAWLLPAPSIYHWWMLRLWRYECGREVLQYSGRLLFTPSTMEIILLILLVAPRRKKATVDHVNVDSIWWLSALTADLLVSQCVLRIDFPWFLVRARRGLDGEWMRRKLSTNWWEQRDQDHPVSASGGMGGGYWISLWHRTSEVLSASVYLASPPRDGCRRQWVIFGLENWGAYIWG